MAPIIPAIVAAAIPKLVDLAESLFTRKRGGKKRGPAKKSFVKTAAVALADGLQTGKADPALVGAAVGEAIEAAVVSMKSKRKRKPREIHPAAIMEKRK